MKTLKMTHRKPRNPLIAAARFRQAGAHGASTGGVRQRAQQALRKELARLKHPSP